MLKKINLRVRFLALKIAFFGGFENDDILSSKSCTDLYEKNLMVKSYLVNLSFKFRKDPSFR